MALSKLIWLVCVLLISGCAGPGRPAPAMGLMPSGPGVRLGPPLGDETPYVPLWTPPVVRPVWVPAHAADADRGTFVAGHWAFLMVEPPRWRAADPVALTVLSGD